MPGARVTATIAVVGIWAGVAFPSLPDVASPGDAIYLNDGLVELVVEEVVAPDARFTHQVEGYEDYRTIPGELPVPVTGPGTYIVVVEGGELAAVGLLVVSDLTLITKESPGGVLGFVQRGDSGDPVEGATLLGGLPLFFCRAPGERPPPCRVG